MSDMLYKHQQKEIELGRDRWGLFYDPGLGKTLTAIKLAESKQLDNCLVITTKSLRRNWQDEIEKWGNGKVDFKVITKEELRRDYEKLPSFKGVIIDECHFFGNPSSQMHKNLMKYLKKHDPRCVWGLTATPIMASVWSVWAIAKILGKNINYMAFKKRYFYEVKMGFRKVPIQKKGIEDDIAELLKTFGSVVALEDAVDLPERVHEFEYFGLTADQKRGIKDLDKDPTTSNHMVYWNKVIQIIGGVLKDSGEVFKSEKRNRVIELSKEHKKLIVVCKHKAELYDLHENIENSYVYCGDTSEEDRDKIIKKLRADEKGVLLLQADMGIGFNLIEIPIMVFYSHTFDFVKYTQCLGRNYRIGQTRPCVYIHLLTEKTIDEDVWKVLERKESFDIALYSRDNVVNEE